MAGRLREEGQHIQVLFKDLVGVWFRVQVQGSGFIWETLQRQCFPVDLIGQLMCFPGVSFELVGQCPVSHL